MYPIMMQKMDISDFMFQVKDYEKITLGLREEQFLQMITTGQRSAYDIYSELNGGETHKGKARGRKLPDFENTEYPDQVFPVGISDSISYKDVHKRVKRLETLGLIEPVQQQQEQKRSKRKVIKYKITSRGLFQDLLGWTVCPNSEKSIPLVYKNDIILQTLLYQFFEEDTVRELAHIFLGDWFFMEYLRNCCQGILHLISWNMYLEKEGAQPIPERQLSDINWVIERELDSLVLEIVKLASNPIYKDKFPIRALVEDQKFTPLVYELRDDLHEGFSRILSRNMTRHKVF